MAAEISSLQAFASTFGLSIWLLILLLVWSAVWKAIALWKSAVRRQLVWFIVFLVVNTLGILEILYIFIFSKNVKKIKTRKRR